MSTLIVAAIAPAFHISGDRNSRYFWREQFDTVPKVTLDGKVIELFCEAKSGPEGFVVVELVDEGGRPRLADVVVDGHVINQIVARQTLRGAVVIAPAPLTNLRCRRNPGAPNELVFTFSHAPSAWQKSYINDCVTRALLIAARPEVGSATVSKGGGYA